MNQYIFSSSASLSCTLVGFWVVIATMIIMLNKQSPSYCFSNLLPQVFILHCWISWTRLDLSFWLWLGPRLEHKVLGGCSSHGGKKFRKTGGNLPLKPQLENGSLKLSFPAMVHCPKQVLLSKPTINSRRKLYSAHRETKTRVGKERRIVDK